jgi:hypothetical protein
MPYHAIYSHKFLNHLRLNMANFIVEMKGGDYLLVAGADNAYAAMRAASSYASTLGVPLSAKPTNPDYLEEPEISFYVCAGR